MAEPAIQVRNLIKRYGDLHAVDDISFEIKKGDVFAFLGPNGAGKTTTVEIIETIRTPTSGEVEILGLDIRKNRKEIIQRIGVLPQEFSSFDRITVRETVAYFQNLFGGGRDIDKLIDMVGLSEERDKWYMNLSGGLKQRLGIAVALANDPEIVFLIGCDGEWYPIEWTTPPISMGSYTMGGWCRCVQVDAENGTWTWANLGEQRDLAIFANKWADNLRMQGFK